MISNSHTSTDSSTTIVALSACIYTYYMRLCIFIICSFHRISGLFILVWVFWNEHFDVDSILAFKTHVDSCIIIVDQHASLLRRNPFKMTRPTEQSLYNEIQRIRCCCSFDRMRKKPNMFLWLFRLWACDCQCGMNGIRHGHMHVLHISYEKKKKLYKKKTMKEPNITTPSKQRQQLFFASWLLTYSMLSLSMYACTYFVFISILLQDNAF